MDSNMERGLYEANLVFSKREAPRIGGSTTAFIAVVVILILIIVLCCVAVVYIIREEAREDAEASSGTRGRYQPSAHQPDGTYALTPKKWYSRLTGALVPSLREKHIRADISHPIMGRRNQGWVRAGNGRDWEVESPDREALRTPQKASSMMQMSDYDSILGPSRSSTGPYPYSFVLAQSPNSDAASSLRSDFNSSRALSYPEPSQSTQAILPTIRSPLHSPPLSPSPSLSPRPRTVPPEGLETSSTNDLNNSTHRISIPSAPPIRTFGGGTKFIEAL